MSLEEKALVHTSTLFANPFDLADLEVFDDATLQRVCVGEHASVPFETLALSLRGAPESLLRRIAHCLSPAQWAQLQHVQRRSCPSQEDVEHARRLLLDRLFWELTYWKTPELYEELTEGEHLHPEIFPRLAPDIRAKEVLDVGAGSGRATIECLRYGAAHVYAVEPSPGLRRILEQKLRHMPQPSRFVSCSGSFEDLPLEDQSVDLALSCSAFTALPGQGGEPGLSELKRVTRVGGKIVLIWPRYEDRAWLEEHGFTYVTLPMDQEMRVCFRSQKAALECARRFYTYNHEVAHYVLMHQSADIPFSVIGLNPPCEYCWLQV